MPHDNVSLQEFRCTLSHVDRRMSDVSQWSVGMHIHHCGLAMIGICRALAKSPLPPPPSRFSLAQSIVLLTGRIPRGRGKSPEEVKPTAEIPATALEKTLDLSERMIGKTRELTPEAWYRHFAFGVLRRDTALRVLDIHNQHHLRIIRDILSA